MNILLKKFIQDPYNIGAVIESSEKSAQKIASIINSTCTQNIIEIGGGTGSLTRFINKKKITIVERDKELYDLLSIKYPGHKIIHSCGLEYLKNYKNKYGLFTSIPLMQSKLKSDFTSIINEHAQSKQIEWFVILGYRIFDQFKNINFNNRKKFFVFNNLPPAFIWYYF
jgi:phospholipid N-methyltransferase